MVVVSTVEQLVEARRAYEARVSEHYDEVLEAVIQSVESSGSVGKADIGALVLWKRISASTRWASALLAEPDAEIRRTTTEVVALARNAAVPAPEAASDALACLAELPGFKTRGALASAVLLAAAPDRMAIYDRRARAGLREVGCPLSGTKNIYRRYLETVEELRSQLLQHGYEWTARDVDKALYWLG